MKFLIGRFILMILWILEGIFNALGWVWKFGGLILLFQLLFHSFEDVLWSTSHTVSEHMGLIKIIFFCACAVGSWRGYVNGKRQLNPFNEDGICKKCGNHGRGGHIFDAESFYPCPCCNPEGDEGSI